MGATFDFLVRVEEPGDRKQVRLVNEAAFGRADEADLVEGLWAEGAVLLSLVAEVDGGIVGHKRIVGHNLFSRMTIDTAHGLLPAVSLAPVAVLPEVQGRGVGSELVRRGLGELRERGEGVVIVLGHVGYYPRFGFSVEKARGLASPFPADAYMAMELRDGALEGVEGVVRYAGAFGC